MPTVSSCLFHFHRPCRKLQAQRRSPEVPSSNDLALSLTDGLLQSDWTLSSPSRGIVSRDRARTSPSLQIEEGQATPRLAVGGQNSSSSPVAFESSHGKYEYSGRISLILERIS